MPHFHLWLYAFWVYVPQSAMDSDVIIPSLFGARRLCNDKLKDQWIHCISHLVSQGEGMLCKESLWRDRFRSVSEWVLCVRVFENLGSKEGKEKIKEKMQKSETIFLGRRRRLQWLLPSFIVFLTFPFICVLPYWQMFRWSMEWTPSSFILLFQLSKYL